MVDEQRVRIRGRKRSEPSILHNSSISKTIIDLDDPAFFHQEVRANGRTRDVLIFAFSAGKTLSAVQDGYSGSNGPKR